MKEDCETDLDWCFKNAVGNTLPSTFYSFGFSPNTSPSKSLSFARAVSEMQLPTMTEVLDRAGTTNSGSAESDPTTSTDSSTSPSPSGYKVKRSYGTANKGTPKGDRHSHRFYEIHKRRSKLSHGSTHWRKRSDGDSSDSTPTTPIAPANLTQAEVSITKGYSDGFMTAKIFAQSGMSRLGFKNQYVMDSIKALGPSTVSPGTEDYYTAWFYHGLSDAESIVGAAINA